MITFSCENTDFPQIDRQKVSLWIRRVAAQYGCKIGQVNYIFCSDSRILEKNRQFLGHDYYTDIITFDYSAAKLLSGDIFISTDTVRSNAEDLGVQYEQELHRVIIHGILHLTGQGDKTPETEREMHRKEDAALKLRS